MKPILSFMILIISGFLYQNCAQTVMEFDHYDSASSLGIGLQIIPDESNIEQILNTQKYVLEVKIPEKGEIQREHITIDGKPVDYIKDSMGNYHFKHYPTEPKTFVINGTVITPNGSTFETSYLVDLKDDTAPTITITPDKTNKYEDLPNTTQRFAVVAEDFGGGAVRQINCYINSTQYNCILGRNGDTSIVTKDLRGGIHTLYVDAIDTYGNKSREILEFSIGADLIAPIASITADSANTFYSIDAQVFAMRVLDNQTGLRSVQCTLNGTPTNKCVSLSNSSASFSYNSSEFRVGINTLTLVADDNSVKNGVLAPNRTTVNRSFNIITDTIAPEIKLIQAAGNTNLVNQAQKVAYSIKDEQSGLKNGSLICRIGNSVIPCTLSSTGTGEITFTPTTIGSHTVTVQMADRYDNIRTESISLDITRDKNIMTINITEANTNPSIVIPNVSLTFNYSIIKDETYSTITQVRCFVQSRQVTCPTQKTGSFSGSFTAAGNQSVMVEATDSTGNVVTKTYNVKVNTIEGRSDNLTVKSNKLLDIVLVIDDSGSMKEEQKNMAEKFGSFTSHLSSMNWRVGVITTDVVAANRNGKLVPVVGAQTHWIESTTTNAQKLIGDTVQGVGLLGNGAEQGIKATYSLITNRNNSPNNGFFREDAALAVVIVSDENESANGTENKSENLISLIKATWPQKPFKVHSIVKTTDACTIGTLGKRYLELAELTGGEIGCVGDQNYSDTLSKMGSATADLVLNHSLQCAPYNSRVVISRNNVVQNIGYTIQGTTLRFNTALPVGSYTVAYDCVR